MGLCIGWELDAKNYWVPIVNTGVGVNDCSLGWLRCRVYLVGVHRLGRGLTAVKNLRSI